MYSYENGFKPLFARFSKGLSDLSGSLGFGNGF